LISCIAFAELLSGLYAGRLNGLKLKDLEQYAKDFMEPEYTSHRRRLELLYERVFVTRLRIWLTQDIIQNNQKVGQGTGDAAKASTKSVSPAHEKPARSIGAESWRRACRHGRQLRRAHPLPSPLPATYGSENR
jgi:hypothetical protein